MILLISEDYIKSNSFIDENIYAKSLVPSIKESQDIDLQQIIGTNLLNYIYELIENNLINNDEYINYKKLLDEYIQPFLLYATISNLIPILATKIVNLGVVVNQDEKVTNISKNERDYLIEQYEYKRDFYANLLKNYLCKNKSKYNELNDCSCGGISPNLTDKTEICGLYLNGRFNK